MSLPHDAPDLYDPCMVLPEMLPSNVTVDEPCTVPKPIVWPDNVPVTVPLLRQALLSVIVPAMVFPFWLNTTVKVPVAEADLVLANVPFQVPAVCPPEAFDVAGALEVAELVITAEALVGVLAGEELAPAVDPFPLPDELHAAVSSMQAVTTVMACLRYKALPLRLIVPITYLRRTWPAGRGLSMSAGAFMPGSLAVVVQRNHPRWR